MTCKHYPHQVSHSCPFLGKARIPERSDEASDPDFPVLAPGGCGRVFGAVPTASAIHLSLPGCSHSSCAAEAWPWAHPGHSRLHPLCSLLNTCSPQQARPTERHRGKAQRIQRCRALYVTVTTPTPTYKVQAADQPNLQSQMEARLTGTIPLFPVPLLSYPNQLVYLRYLCFWKIYWSEKENRPPYSHGRDLA